MPKLVTARNEVGVRLYFHRHVWFCSQWGVPGPGCGVHGPRRVGGVPGLEGRGAWSRGVHGGEPPETATAAGGRHPTGMYSCSWIVSSLHPRSGLIEMPCFVSCLVLF